MTSEQRIPDDLPVALDDAAGLRQDWTRGGPESEVSLNRRPASIGEIFRLVAAFSDRAADDEYRFSLIGGANYSQATMPPATLAAIRKKIPIVLVQGLRDSRLEIEPFS